MEKLARFTLIVSLIVLPAAAQAYSSGSRSSSSGFSSRSFSSSSSSKSFSAPKSYSAPKTYAAPKTTYKAPSYSAPKANASTKTSAGSSSASATQKVGGSYRPTFSGGYTPPTGSVVHYQGFSFTDFLFWNYLLNHHPTQTVTVQQPDGKKVNAQTNSVDWMYWIDWLLVVLLSVGLIVFIVWLVNKKSKGNPKYAV